MDAGRLISPPETGGLGTGRAAGAPRGVVAWGFDSYGSPEAQSLLRAARERFRIAAPDRRLATTELVGAAVYLASAAALAVLVHSRLALSPARLAITIAAYIIAVKIRFPVGSAHTAPTQIVFVPMLFLLPLADVPLVLAGCALMEVGFDRAQHDVTLTRALAKLGDKAYALGPVLVLLLAHQQAFSWSHWPVLALAFVAQVVFDAGSGLGRTWFAERILPREQLEMLWLYATDLCLSCCGALVAASAIEHPALVLLTLPMLAMIGLFARERQQRLDHTLELSSAYRGTAMLLGDVIEADDEYTGVHSRDVVQLSLAVADRLGLAASERLRVEFAALLHDVGKIHVPPEIIRKPGALDEREMAIMRRHTILGEEMLEKVGGTLSSVGRIVRATHERFDGGGYPDRLAGAEIPLAARIVAACDAYNAMTTDRPYRAALPRQDAEAELQRCAGSQFDPAVVEVLLRELS
jgi:putative nucleotidyltransferase with HDIG domain